ncbi:hypothetical protein G0U57_014898 [Chelydra serpentina]|uniref:Uncharacterized protein n=1 Tax=Chelydra serpentina TaxID=8475 RepID=A0A8T1T1K3_CHESE|nr:hypothetical protein G0U57_014898 [Chelydra serpentina]
MEKEHAPRGWLGILGAKKWAVPACQASSKRDAKGRGEAGTKGRWQEFLHSGAAFPCARGESKIHRLPLHPGTGHSFPTQAPVGPVHRSGGRSPGEIELAAPASQTNKQAQDLNTNHHPTQQHLGKQGRSASAVPVPAAFISPWNRDKREASPLVGSHSLGSATLCRKLAPIPDCCEERPGSERHICKAFTISCGILQLVTILSWDISFSREAGTEKHTAQQLYKPQGASHLGRCGCLCIFSTSQLPIPTPQSRFVAAFTDDKRAGFL